MVEKFDSSSVKKPFDAYEGDEPYIFISYAHKDRGLVFPEIMRFHDEGYPIWYDDGLTPGQEWDEEIEEALENCSLLVVFISKNSMASKNVVDEIKLAIEEDIDIVPIHFEKTRLAKGLKLRLSSKHAIFKYIATEEDYLKDCFKAFDKSGIPKLEEVSKTVSSSEERVNQSSVEELEKPAEIASNMMELPFNPYEGDEPYAYVSYSHRDARLVFPEIKRFNDEGYNLWYDKGIVAGSDYTEHITKRIGEASLMIVFLTVNSVKSKILKDEINIAVSKRIPILPIYLDDYDAVYDSMDLHLQFELTNINPILKTNLSEEDYVYKYVEAFKGNGLIPIEKPNTLDIINGLPFRAYGGDEDYIFVTYAHKDADIIFPEIKRFHDQGYHIWYDEIISPGNEWQNEIVKHLNNASLLVIFITFNSIKSKIIKRQIFFAVSKRIPILPIYLDDYDAVYESMDLDLQFELINTQGILKTNLSDEEYVYKYTSAFKSFGLLPK